MSETSRPTLRVRLDLAYDGTRLLRVGGAARPAHGRGHAVGGARHRAAPARSAALTVAGRTDAGVHARGQVVHLDVPTDAWAAVPGRSDRAPGAALVSRLAGVLPVDVVVRPGAEAAEGFDARFAALERRYLYRIVGPRRPTRPAATARHRVVAPSARPRRHGRGGPPAPGPARLRGLLQAPRRSDDHPHPARVLVAAPRRRGARRHGAGRRLLPLDGALPRRRRRAGGGGPARRRLAGDAAAAGGAGRPRSTSCRRTGSASRRCSTRPTTRSPSAPASRGRAASPWHRTGRRQPGTATADPTAWAAPATTVVEGRPGL